MEVIDHPKKLGRAPFLQFREVLVTGGGGFVGRHVCRALAARGFLPRILVRPGSEGKIPEDLRKACRITPGDATVREFVENAAQGTDAIVHLVGIIREFPAKGITFEKLHVDATRNALHAARKWGITRFVHMSALGAEPGGITAYFDTKGRAEELVRGSGLDWTIFRPSVIFGPEDRFINELSAAIRKAPFLPVAGDGRYRLQPVFVGDVARGFADAVSRTDLTGKIFEVGGPEKFSYNELLDRIAASVGRKVRRVHIPVSRMARLVRLLSRFEKFPVTVDQLAMLLAESACDETAFYEAFSFTPFPLTAYLQKAEGRS
ncbi:MAG: NAD(P)H-binding protein [Deltaproteobacteria bacterium]